MPSLKDVRDELAHYSRVHSIWLDVSALYDLFPSEGTAHPEVAYTWPEKWPNGKYQGIYLFLDSTLSLLYVGKLANDGVGDGRESSQLSL